MNKVDEILEFLAMSGESYTLDEISNSIGVPCEACKEIVRFLERYGFVRKDDSKVKINPKIRVFIIATSDKALPQAPSRVSVTAYT